MEIIESLVVVEARTSAINRTGYIAQLADGVSMLPDEPNPELFEVLHENLVIIHQVQLDYVVFEETGSANEIRVSHKRFIQRLREISRHLGIQYQEPDDPILKEERVLTEVGYFVPNIAFGVQGSWGGEPEWLTSFKIQGELGKVVISEASPTEHPNDCQVQIELVKDLFPDKLDRNGNPVDLRNLNHRSFLARTSVIAEGVSFTLDGSNEYQARHFYRLTFKARR